MRERRLGRLRATQSGGDVGGGEGPGRTATSSLDAAALRPLCDLYNGS